MFGLASIKSFFKRLFHPCKTCHGHGVEFNYEPVRRDSLTDAEKAHNVAFGGAWVHTRVATCVTCGGRGY